MKAVVLLSGGLDSTTCLALALQNYEPGEVLALNMFYGQKHDREMQSARDVAKHYGVELMELDLSPIFAKSDCSLLKASTVAIPEGSYAEQQKEHPGKPVSTYVPFRNGLMLAAAASIAVSVGAQIIYYGAHADDAAGNAYPDCTPYFSAAMNNAVYEGTGGQVILHAPFIERTKADIVELGTKLDVPYELTWSCYAGGDHPCGKCGTCIDRQKAFEANGLVDPVK